MIMALRLDPLKRVGAAATLAVMLAVAPAPGLSPALARGPAESFADLAEKLLPAVVNISTVQTSKPEASPGPGATPGRPRSPDAPRFPPGSPLEEYFKEFFDRQQRGEGGRPDSAPRRSNSLGSGFIVDPTGFIVTNNHVIDGADEINVILHDDTTLKARLIGKDAATDLALLKVDPKRPLAFVPWGNSDKARIGDPVVAIGNPLGLGGTVTAGIISARSRDIGSGRYDDFLQTDASINKGNSGGPMFNMAGEVIGINTAIYSPSGGSIGIGFAIPSALAKPVVDQIRQFGKAKRGWLGVRIQTVTDELAESLGLDKPKGALVSAITDGGPAGKAKIEPGDVIIRFDGREVADMKRLPRIVADTPVDKTVDVVVWRKKREVTLKATVAELVEGEQVASAAPAPKGPEGPATRSVTAAGLQLSALTPQLRERFGLAEDAPGVVVTEVSSRIAATDRSVRPGDLIVEVSQEEVKTPADVVAKIKAAKDSGKKSVLLMVDQKGDLRFIALRLDQD